MRQTRSYFASKHVGADGMAHERFCGQTSIDWPTSACLTVAASVAGTDLSIAGSRIMV